MNVSLSDYNKVVVLFFVYLTLSKVMLIILEGNYTVLNTILGLLSIITIVVLYFINQTTFIKIAKKDIQDLQDSLKEAKIDVKNLTEKNEKLLERVHALEKDFNAFQFRKEQ
ncbi:MAG: hypothetical protein Ta2B_05500 [Termitinemataceae bacterium]|nr:MAG: hypothetical protein Ta2B_05500 [Termitinemataceae bacterium]